MAGWDPLLQLKWRRTLVGDPMNYLAHLYLADTSEEFIIGSFLGDFVKGSIGDRYSQEVNTGIRFHRKIDIYADTHAKTIASRNLFGREKRRFSGIILDICYDHFLSTHWSEYSDIDLPEFIANAYELLQKYQDIFPQRLKSVLPRLISQNWLGTYLTLEGVEITLNRIAKRLSRKNSLEGSLSEIRSNYTDLETNFLIFFPDLVAYAKSFIREL
jgi:acyl carrier protein phosphodiesterase